MVEKFKPIASVAITVARKSLEYYIDLVIEKGPVVITRYGKPVALLISFKAYEEIQFNAADLPDAEKPEQVNVIEGEEEKFVVIEVDIPEDLLEEALKYAEQAGQSLNDFIVEAVSELVQRLQADWKDKQREEKPSEKPADAGETQNQEGSGIQNVDKVE